MNISRGLFDQAVPESKVSKAPAAPPQFTRWGVHCTREERSVFGPTSPWLKDELGRILTFPDRRAASAIAKSTAERFGAGVRVKAEGYE